MKKRVLPVCRMKFMTIVLLALFTTQLWGQSDGDTVKMSAQERLKAIISKTNQSTNSNMGPNSVRVKVSIDSKSEKLVLEEIAKGKIFPKNGDMFVDFTVQQDPHDASSKVSLSDYVGKGKYVILDFWASWCAPCIADLEAIRHAYQNLPKDKVTIISIAINDRLERTIAAAKKYNIEWEQIVNAGNIPMLVYGFTKIPQVVLFAPDGTILRNDIGGEELLTFTARHIRNNYRESHPNAVRNLTY